MSNDKYDVPAYPVSRVRYYTGQFLREDDFIAEEAYHVAHQRRHDRLLHVAGVTEGLEVTAASGGGAIEVAPGSAFDAEGRHILLAARQTITVDPAMSGVAYVEIAFSEAESHPADQNSTVQANTRFSQSATPAAIVRTRTPGAVTLASLTVTSGAPVLSFAERAYSGVRLPGPANVSGGGVLRSRGDATPGWAELGCSLSVLGNATVSGSASVAGTLGVTGAVTAGSHVTVGGNAGVAGTLSVTGAVTASSNATVGGTLGVTGAVTMNSHLTVGGNQNLGGALGVGGLLTANNGLTVGAGSLTVSTLAANQAVFTNGSKQLATGTLPVSMGGTGVTSLTGVLRGNGAGAFSAMTGTVNRLARWSDANTLAASSLITDNGWQVGVGPLNPQTHLHVSGVNPVLRIEATGGGGWSEIDLYSSYEVPDQRYWNIAAQGNGGLSIRQLTDARALRNVPLFIDPAGNVGLGTTAPRGRLDLGYGGPGQNLRIGDYLDMGETALSNFFYMGINAVLSTSTITPPVNRFKPGYAPGTGMVMAQAAGGVSDLEFYGINWNGDAGEKDFSSAFTHVLHLGTNGNVGIATTNPVAKLDIAQGGRWGAHPGGVKGLYVTGDFGQYSDGVEFRHANGTQGIGIGFGGIYATGSNADQDIYLRPRGGGRLVVQGVITGGTNMRPLTEQMVHRRILYGYASQGRFAFDAGWRELNFCYGPFEYAVPPPQSGATRKYRLYAIYTDSITTAGANEIRFRLDDGSVTTFSLPPTWGGGWNAAENRDGYSNWVTQPSTRHGRIDIRTTVSGTSGALHYLEVQAWDFFS